MILESGCYFVLELLGLQACPPNGDPCWAKVKEVRERDRARVSERERERERRERERERERGERERDRERERERGADRQNRQTGRPKYGDREIK